MKGGNLVPIDIDITTGAAAGIMGTNSASAQANDDRLTVVMNGNGTVDYVVVWNDTTTYGLTWAADPVVLSGNAASSYTVGNFSVTADAMAWTSTPTINVTVTYSSVTTSSHNIAFTTYGYVGTSVTASNLGAFTKTTWGTTGSVAKTSTGTAAGSNANITGMYADVALTTS